MGVSSYYEVVDQEEKEKLEKLEMERERRMQGVSPSESRDTGDMQEEDVRVGVSRAFHRRRDLRWKRRF